MEKNASKALYFHTFSKMFLSKFTLKNIYNAQVCSNYAFITLDFDYCV